MPSANPVTQPNPTPAARHTHRERLDAPHDARLLGHVFDAADGGLELGRVGVRRHGDDDLHVVGRGAPLEL